jgi:hypothetical protein
MSEKSLKRRQNLVHGISVSVIVFIGAIVVLNKTSGIILFSLDLPYEKTRIVVFFLVPVLFLLSGLITWLTTRWAVHTAG